MFGIHVKDKEWQHGVWGPGVLVYIEGRYMQGHILLYACVERKNIIST